MITTLALVLADEDPDEMARLIDDAGPILLHKDDAIIICIDDETAGYGVADEVFVAPLHLVDMSSLTPFPASEHDTIQPRLDTFVF